MNVENQTIPEGVHISRYVLREFFFPVMLTVVFTFGPRTSGATLHGVRVRPRDTSTVVAVRDAYIELTARSRNSILTVRYRMERLLHVLVNPPSIYAFRKQLACSRKLSTE